MIELRLAHISLAAIQADPVRSAQQAVVWAAKHQQLIVHLDVDVREFTDFPIAENVRRADGLTFDGLSQALATLTAAPNWRALTLTEINPDHAPDEEESFRRLINMLAAALARTRDRPPNAVRRLYS